jgi:hypothetical protein
MTELFRRRYVLDIGDVEITGLDVAFSVERSLRREPNRASIRVWNLAEDHRQEIGRADRVRVRLEAGYESASAVIFDGFLVEGLSRKDGAEWVTELRSGDGHHAARSARVSLAYRPGASVRAALERCAETLGVGLGNAVDAFSTATTPSGSVLRQGTALSGRADDVLTTLCEAAGLEWSIQGGVLQVLGTGRALRRDVVRLTPSTGLVGSPHVDSRGVLHAEALLVPELEPGRRVSIESTHVQGTWRVRKASYVGDWSGKNWGVSIEGEQEGAS